MSKVSDRGFRFDPQEKIVSLPLEYSYLPVDILSKQFTKLNNPHQYRIHYLGPRPPNTQILHKKYTQNENYFLHYPSLREQTIPKYVMNVKKIAQSYFINEKLRNNHFYKSGLYYRAFQGMNPTLNFQQQFIFNSNFQSGNLDCVIKTKPLQFDLFLRIDSNTRGHLQWFYFSVQNGNKKQKIRLNICNISKARTLYETGMNPFVYSSKNGKKSQWKQGSKNLTNCTLTQKDFQYEIIEKKCKNFHPFCLSFDYEFEQQDEEVFFAYCPPYTYSEMLYDIDQLPSALKKTYTLGRSLTGVDIPLLHITNHSINKEKKNVLITGRIHPAESNSSYTLKGFLSFLCSDHKYAVEIRKVVNFYIIPMINPDGVILGNSRTSAAGRDMNRMFIETDVELFPEISQLKSFTGRFLRFNEILLYYDFHGHSRKKNTFFYGPSYNLGHQNYYKCRILPKLIEKKINAFRYYSCLFAISQEKKTTGRASMFQYFEIPFTYTIQSSIGCYYDSQKMKTFLYDIQSWKEMGERICQGTCGFIFGYQQYELLLKERRAIREKKKLQKLGRRPNLTITKLFLEQQALSKPDEVMKIVYKGEADMFIEMIDQIKKTAQEKPIVLKGVDQEASSDDHDDKEDFQASKMKQFNNLIIQNAQKENLMKKLMKTEKGPEEEKIFIRNRPDQKNFVLKNNKFRDSEEVNLIEEICNKPSSSVGNRKGYLLTDRSSTSNQKKRVVASMGKQSPQIQKKKNQKTLDLNADFTAPMAKRKTNMSLRETVRDTFKKEHLQKMIEKRTSQISTENIAHFAQISFPEERTEEDQKMMLRNSNNGHFRKNRQYKKQQRSDKYDLINRFSELSMEKKVDPTSSLIKQKIPTEFKFDQILSNIELKSKMLKNSVKYKEQKRSKPKTQNACVFPSSFYGVQQQHELKRKPNSFENIGVPERQDKRIRQQVNTGFTIKKFK